MSKDQKEDKTAKKPEINREKVEFLKNKFNILRKIKPLKMKKSTGSKEEFNPRNIDKNKKVDISAIWEKERRERTAEERYFYKKEARTYHKYFFLYLSREIRRTRWTPRKQLNNKFITTVLFIAFLSVFFYGVEQLVMFILQAANMM